MSVNTAGTSSTQEQNQSSGVGATAAVTTMASSSGVATSSSHPSSAGCAGAQHVTGANSRAMTFWQLQEELNSFMLELQKQEELFFDQVKKANDQQKVLMSASEKISNLQSTTQKLKSDSERINQALEYVKDQQTEMERILDELEPSIPEFVLDVDPQRQELYSSALDINNQLGKMGQDLKVVIEYINEKNHAADTAKNPINRILKIVNEHTDILTWVDQNCDKLRRSLYEARTNHEELTKSKIVGLRQVRH